MTRVLTLVLSAALAGGCDSPARFRYKNQAPFIEQRISASRDGLAMAYFKNSILVPARDLLTLDPLWRHVGGDEAWNVVGDDVPDTSFYTHRAPEELTPDSVARGSCTAPPPLPPFTVTKAKTRGATAGFIGRDGLGRKFLFKLDDPDYPELGSSAEIIGSRLLLALGYNVPAVYLVRIEGTGAACFDGRRATATQFIEAQGQFYYDWFRYRRELRGLRLAAAWVNDTDRVDHNTLVVNENGRARYYLIDSNSALGSWQGRPKEPWRGWRPAADALWNLVGVVSLGLLLPEPHGQKVFSPAVGRFDAEHFEPLSWRAQWHNNAFEHMTAADARWMAALIRRLDRPQIEAVIAAAKLSDLADARYLVETLLARREKVLRTIE